MIHPTAIIAEGVQLGADCKIGPFCIVGPRVVLGDRVELISHVVIENSTVIGDDSVIFPFAVIGAMGQDRKYQEEESMTGVLIGKRCKIREYATINQGTPASSGTEVGDDCQIMIHAHIGHDCKIGNNVVLSNEVALAGHVEIEDNAIISAKSAVHQFCRVGKNSFLGGMSGAGTDVLPYSIFEGIPARYRTINKVGLLRHGFTNEDLHAVHAVYSAMFGEGGISAERLRKVRREVNGNKYALDAIDFIENRSKRGVSGKV